jgi:hypothetical protein
MFQGKKIKDLAYAVLCAALDVAVCAIGTSSQFKLSLNL